MLGGPIAQNDLAGTGLAQSAILKRSRLVIYVFIALSGLYRCRFCGVLLTAFNPRWLMLVMHQHAGKVSQIDCTAAEMNSSRRRAASSGYGSLLQTDAAAVLSLACGSAATLSLLKKRSRTKNARSSVRPLSTCPSIGLPSARRAPSCLLPILRIKATQNGLSTPPPIP